LLILITDCNTPFVTALTVLGTVKDISMLSALSAKWSLHGQNKSHPSPCTAAAIQGVPFSVLLQTKPPDHGARRAMCGIPE
jgi:hypothetical protein